MNAYDPPAQILWHRYHKTRSSEYRQALLEHYTPFVQMQTAFWAYGLDGCLVTSEEQRTHDGLAEPAEGPFFLPSVPRLQKPTKGC